MHVTNDPIWLGVGEKKVVWLCEIGLLKFWDPKAKTTNTLRPIPMFESNLGEDPHAILERWLEEAKLADPARWDAMVLATATLEGAPSARVVLLRGCDRRGLVFFTNYGSRKGVELEENPAAALLFYWPALRKQLRIEGDVERVSRNESIDYFNSRPLLSRYAACASSQSHSITSRKTLVAKFDELRRGDAEPNCPEHWGGFRLAPSAIEFWQEGEHRLHHRVRFDCTEDGAWTSTLLAP